MYISTFKIITMKNLVLSAFLVLLALSCGTGQDQGKSAALSERDQHMEWWRDARFGLFIHWGLYAQPAGVWKGEEIPGISEWIMARAEIPVKEYEQLAATFNPVKFNAEQWVSLAKQAGMKYIVITSKHHDGFAMFHSQASSYNIVDATPFDRDPLKELAEACKKQDMRLGFYYSQAQDWHEPGGTYWNIEQGEPHWDPDMVREPLMNYMEGKAVPQVKEILENYGGLDILWWDTPRGMTLEAAEALQAVTARYPDLITNNRLYRPWPGDFSTPEQNVPPTGLDYDWEVCMTMNTSWGYKKNDHNWKSDTVLIRMLTDIASKGGNLLLNVGPTAEGEIPGPSVERLQAIGRWMDVNGESIYGTGPSPFFRLPWGRCTSRTTDKGTTLYLHVFRWPEEGILRVPGLTASILSVRLLSDPSRKLSFRSEGGDLLIELPERMPDPISTVVVLDTRGTPEIASNMPAWSCGRIRLPADFADIHNPGYGTHIILQGSGREARITNWTDPGAWLEWMFHSDQAGTYAVMAQIRTREPGKLTVRVGEEERIVEIPVTGQSWSRVNLGEIDLRETGDQFISLRPVPEEWTGMELGAIILEQ